MSLFDTSDLEDGDRYHLEFKNTGTAQTVEHDVEVERDPDEEKVWLNADNGARYYIPFGDNRLYVGPSQVGHNVRLFARD